MPNCATTIAERICLKLSPTTNVGEAPRETGLSWPVNLLTGRFMASEIDSTAEQDETFIDLFNDRRNKSHFNLLFHNCADFSSVVLDIFLPHAIHRNFIADVGLMTPKQACALSDGLFQKIPPP